MTTNLKKITASRDELNREIIERKKVEKALLRQTHDLGERVKELSCLYSISKVIERQNISIEDILQEIVNIIPPSWQYPEITCARIKIGDEAFTTESFRETAWRQVGNIFVHEEQVGRVDVFYLKEMPKMDEGPFLKEERYLINEIATRLSRVIDRKKAEEELKKRHHQNALLLDSLPYASMLIRKNRIIIAANKAALDIGVKIGTHCWDSFGKLASIPSEDREYFKKHGKAPVGGTKCHFCMADVAIATQKPKDVEVVLDGTVWDTYWIPLDDDTYLHYAIDITRRKREEEELRESRDGLNKAQETVHLGNWDQDMTTDELLWSDEAYRIFGLSPQQFDITFEKFIEMVHPDDRSLIIEKTALASGEEAHPFNLQYRLIRPDGSIRTVHEQAEVIRDDSGKAVRMVGTTLDITERKEAEEALRTLNNAIEQTAEAVVITDVKGTVEYVNPGFEKITGYTKKEIIGRNPRILKSGRQDGSFYKNLWDTINSGNIWKGKIVNKRKSGELYEEEMTISPILQDHGEITHFVAIKRDVSEQKRLQQQLIHAEKLSSVGTFVAGVAHELNNPLTTILGFSQELARIEGLPNEVKHDLNVIAEESRRTVGIVKNLLRFSRKYKPGKVPFDVNEVVDDTVNLQAYRFKTENITINKKCAQNLPLVCGNVNQIRQVFMNIILNARDAMLSANKGGTLTIKTEASGPKVKVIFENDGPPIPPENFNRIFDPFFTTKEVGVGTGLGLSISFGIIKEHDGTLWADNLGGKGVKFTLTLPAVSEPVEQAVSAPGRIELPENLHILLVEDESKIEQWLARILVNNGINVQTVANGKEAVKYLEQNNDFDVILSDIKMPEMDGFELVNWLNDNTKHYLNRLVLITGVTDQDVDDCCDRYGCRSLLKPFEEKQVMEIIRAVVKSGVSL